MLTKMFHNLQLKSPKLFQDPQIKRDREKFSKT